jgi:hypothetical protein
VANYTSRRLAGRLQQFAAEIEGVTRRGVNESALLVTTSVAAFLGGRSIHLSGVGSSGAKVAVRYDIKGSRNPTAVVYMTGPAQLVERDTRAHTILGRSVGRGAKGRGARQANKQALYDALFGSSAGGRMRVAGDWRTGPFRHPGTTGKHPFERGVTAVRQRVTDIYRRGVHAAGRRIFTG